MSSLRFGLLTGLAAILLLSLGGCLYDFPLSSPSTNLDTRLLGVFEYTERVPRPEDAADDAPDPEPIIHRVASLRQTDDTYLIFYRNFSQKPAKVLRFNGWISRVDDKYYLTLEDDTEGSPTRGKFSFVKYEWRFPANIIISAPNMQALETATSFEMRQGVRARLKDDTLFPYQPTQWDRIARTYWDHRETTDPASTIPKEFEQGTTRQNPGF